VAFFEDVGRRQADVVLVVGEDEGMMEEVREQGGRKKRRDGKA
jgi:hypothetical protein